MISVITPEKILGTWKVLRFEDEYYLSAGNMVEHNEYSGDPGASLVFEPNNHMHAYSALFGSEVLPYYLLNESTINIETEQYQIRRLSDTELSLYAEDTDAISGEGFVRKMYLVRIA